MKYAFNPYVAKLEKVTYAKEEDATTLLDCGDGCSPYGCSEKVLAELNVIKTLDVPSYPHGFALKDAIIRYWQDYIKLERQMLSLHNGGMDAIAAVNLIFAREGTSVLGVTPQFTDYVLNARCHGYEYKSVPLLAEEAYLIYPQRIVEAMDETVALVYLDNPNNPTGQSLSLNDLRHILNRAAQMGICVIVDEAYGDYLEPKDSAITLVDTYTNLVVMRSLSKGTGLAGMRAAYIVAAPEVIEQIDKVSNPYCISNIGRRLAVAALSDTAFMENNRKKIAAAKRTLRECTGKKLKLSHTLDSCTICLLTHEDTTCDLAAQFAALGVKVVSGIGFDNLGANSVRLRIPQQNQEQELFRVVRMINEA